MSIQGVLFDLDGTLLDTAPDFETAVNRLLSEENMPALKPDAIRTHVGNGSAKIVANVFDIETHAPEFPGLKQRLLEHYKTYLTDRTQMFPGLESSINLLERAGLLWGVVTNKPSEYANPIVESLLANSAVLVCPDHVSQPKPHPEGILLACKKTGIQPADCIYVGDHLRDIQAGQTAGTMTIAVGWGYIGDEEHHNQWGADWVADNPEDLAPLLKSILNN